MRSLFSSAVALLLLTPALDADSNRSDVLSDSAQQNFQELDRKAQVDFRLGRFPQAAEEFQRAVCFAPENFRQVYARFKEAAESLAKGDYAEARQVLRQAERLRPDYPLPLAMLVKVDLLSGDSVDLKAYLLASAQRFPFDARLHSGLSQDFIHQRQFDLALAEALRSEGIGAVDGKTGLNLAVLENQAGAFADAARHAAAMEQEAELPSKVRASAAAIAGLSLENLGQLEQAETQLKAAIHLDPDQEPPYLALARIYGGQHDTDAEEKILYEAQKRLGGSADLLLTLASLLLSVEQFQSASEILSGLVQKFPDKFEAYLRLAEAFRDLGEPSRATSILQDLARRKPDDPLLHIVIARSMLAEEKVDYSRALEELAAAERITPEEYDIHYLRGKVFLSRADYPRAVASLQRAVELRPMEPGAHYELAAAYRKLGQIKLAEEQYAELKFIQEPVTLLTSPE